MADKNDLEKMIEHIEDSVNIIKNIMVIYMILTVAGAIFIISRIM